tara:strand:+ start:56 stop:1282 length:1227 start_codon:yes stop_codon:yes gene_type:complete
MTEQNTPWLDKQRKIASRCEKELGRPPKDGYAYRVYGGVCVEERLLPGGTTASDQMKAAARAARVDEEGNRDLSAFEEIEEVEVAAAEAALDATKITLKQLPAVTVNHQTSLRYPRNPPINKNSDYIAFQFYSYAPPFKQAERNQGATSGYENGQLKGFTGYDYNQVNSYKPNGDPTILLYMPEDVSTGFKANWGGKAFSTFATNTLRAAGGETTGDKLKQLGNAIGEQADKIVPLIGATAIRKGIQKITGDSLSNDDVFGAISGAILNPNTELLFEGVDMRNFQLTFKLMPRNQDESIDINKIIKQFKRTMLPRKGASKVFGISNTGVTNGFIGVPDLVRVAFMHGPGEHPHLPKFKMCAITQVDVNYTPDGSYATYEDGQPVAIELRLNLQETKLVFAEDIDQGIA